MNYLLHNLGYDKPVNFREIVLRQYHSNCVWLRDTYFHQLSMTSYKPWLPDLEYYENSLRAEKRRLQEHKRQLAGLTEEKLQKMYEQEVNTIESLRKCKNTYHVDEIAKIKRCTDEYNKHLQKWLSLPNTPKYLNSALIDIYETAIKDMAEHDKSEDEAMKRIRSRSIPTYEDFKNNTISRIKNEIDFCKEQVASKTRAVKMVKDKIADVKQIFAWLDEVEKEENKQC
jgi:hypothetical protein